MLGIPKHDPVPVLHTKPAHQRFVELLDISGTMRIQRQKAGVSGVKRMNRPLQCSTIKRILHAMIVVYLDLHCSVSGLRPYRGLSGKW